MAPNFFISIYQNLSWRRRHKCFPILNQAVLQYLSCYGVSSVTETKPETIPAVLHCLSTVVRSWLHLDRRQKILRAGETSWGLIHSLLYLTDVGAGEDLDLVSEVQIILLTVMLTVFYLRWSKCREGMARNVGGYLGVVSVVELASISREKKLVSFWTTESLN